jgi:uncharacterized membrane protein YeaQ/YmgE (transglycosylase-associated protein family)
MNIVIGVIGGFVAGGLLHWLGVDVADRQRWVTFFVSLLGAVILLWVVGLFRKTRA